MRTFSLGPSPIRAALAAQDAAPTSRGSEHLAEYSFRFDVDALAPALSVPRPDEGDAWSLAQTLQEIRFRGVSLVKGSVGLRVPHAHRLPALANAVIQYEAEVSLWLDLDGPAHALALGWDDQTELHARWMDERFEPPRTPFALRPGVSVTDWRQFEASVHDRVSAGPDAPRAESVRRDLADLFGQYAVLTREEPALQAPARAA